MHGTDKQIAYATARKAQYLAAIAEAPAILDRMIAESVADGITLAEIEPVAATMRAWLADIATVINSTSAPAILDLTDRVKIARDGGLPGWMVQHMDGATICADERIITQRAVKLATA